MTTYDTVNGLFGRRWSLAINANAAQRVGPVASGSGGTIPLLVAECSSFQDPESIQVSFDVIKKLNAFWWCDVTLYNLNAATFNTVFQSGTEVILSAGYQGKAPYGEIFRGRVFQTMWDRREVVDFCMTLRCVVGKFESADNIVIGNLTAEMTSQKNIVGTMMNASFCANPIGQGSIPSTLAEDTNPRGKVIMQQPQDIVEEIAESRGEQWFFNHLGFNFGNSRSSVPPNQAIVISSKTGLIGVPQQIEESGITFKTLLDPRLDIKIEPMTQVYIDNKLIRQAKRQLGINPSMLDNSGYYNVSSVRHYGDTRGNDWHTEVIAWSPVYGRAGLEAGLAQEINQ